MNIYKYNDFILNEELKDFQKLNEEAAWEDLSDKLFLKLEDAFKKGERVFFYVVKKMIEFFRANPKVLLLIVGLLVAKYQFSKQQVMDVVPEGTSISAEELYAKSREGKGLPEDEYEKTTTTHFNHKSGGLDKFLSALASKESTSNPDTINKQGYMGKYQFGEIALKDILLKRSGETDEEYEERINKFYPKNAKNYQQFRRNFEKKGRKFWPEHKQDAAMKELLINNTKYLGDYLDKWVGKTKKGIKLTKSGLLAGAHLLGPSNVKRFLDDGIITKDANGTPITEYIQKFGGYAINL